MRLLTTALSLQLTCFQSLSLVKAHLRSNRIILVPVSAMRNLLVKIRSGQAISRGPRIGVREVFGLIAGGIPVHVPFDQPGRIVVFSATVVSSGSGIQLAISDID